MAVCEGVKHVPGIAATFHEPGGMQDFQPSRDTAQLGLLEFDQLGDATLALRQQDEQPQPGRIAQRMKHCAGRFELGRRGGDRGPDRVVVGAGRLHISSIYDFIE